MSREELYIQEAEEDVVLALDTIHKEAWPYSFKALPSIKKSLRRIVNRRWNVVRLPIPIAKSLVLDDVYSINTHRHWDTPSFQRPMDWNNRLWLHRQSPINVYQSHMRWATKHHYNILLLVWLFTTADRELFVLPFLPLELYWDIIIKSILSGTEV